MTDRELTRALCALFFRQTLEERRDGVTLYDNKEGFNKFDAPMLTALAEYYLRHGRLDTLQMNMLKKLLPKYTNQITEVL